MQDRRTLNRYLGNRGLATLDDGRGLVAQLGFLVEDDKHFRQLLNKCAPEERRNMYEALRPHLGFTPKPLDVYISELGMEAEAQQLPTVDADGKFQPYRVPEIQAIADVVEATLATKHLILTCKKCTKEATFHGGTRADTIYKARAEGWTYGVDPKAGENDRAYEICPDCPAAR